MNLDKNIRGKKVLIIGLSRSGEAAALLAAKKQARVYVSELIENIETKKKADKLRRYGITVELGQHSLDFFKGAFMLITSPGVKNDAKPILWAKKNSVPIISEIEFASWFCHLPIIAITGTNGKTTVTTLIGKILKDIGKKVIVCGNIGNPFSGEYRSFEKADIVVLEVSSFQLQYTRWFHPKVGIILNITQNHFDHHATFQEYFQAKARIFANQGKNDFAVLNFDDLKLRALSRKLKGKKMFFSKDRDHLLEFDKHCYASCWLNGCEIKTEIKGKEQGLLDINKLKLKGLHNVENVMAAILAVSTQAVSIEKMGKTLKSFSGVEHRCEPVAVINRVRFINDSKSTTVDATFRALSMFPNRSVILICGGRDKGSDFTPIRELIKEKVRLLVGIGEAREKIIKAMKNAIPVKTATNLKDAVTLAFNNAVGEEIVLLSPMCASFDMFKNYEERGRVFKETVRQLKRICH